MKHAERLFAAALLAMPVLVGCAPAEYDLAEMANQQRARPAELDQLEFLIGNWTSESEAKMPNSEEVLRGTGTSKTTWGIGKRFLTTEFTGNLGGGMGNMTGTEYWTWDAAAKKFRTWWFDNWGGVAHGSAKYDAKNKVWRIHGSARSTLSGRKSVQKGTMTVVDDNTIKWTWSEYDSLGLFKMFEMTGVNRRQ